MVGDMFLAIAMGYLAMAVGTVIWYNRRQRRLQREAQMQVQVPVNPE